jgi:glucose/arabinose dehydrogenase
MKSRNVRVGWGLVCLLVAMSPASADVLPTNLKIDQVLDNSQELGAMEISPTGEIWLLERTTGTIRVYVAGAEKASLTIPVTSICDSGLLDLAFAPDYFASGLTFLSYVDAGGDARVDRLYNKGVELQLGGNILMLGTPVGGCRPGGGLSVGPDSLLYIGVGDMGVPLDAQDDLKIQGKVLRAKLDGSVPPGNTSGTLVWAKGFRHSADLDVGWNGTVYVADQGENLPVAVFDETNAVLEGNNHGWNLISGSSGGIYDDPLTADSPMVKPDGVNLLGPGLGEDYEDTLTYACSMADDIRQAVLKGPDLDQMDSSNVIYDPLADATGVPDAGCPKRFDTLAEAGDGWLYGANNGDNPGIWRIWHDTAGPREVSPPGSPLQLTVAKVATAIELEWEELGPRDAHLTYRIWQGTLPFAGYDHSHYFSTNGTSAGVARVKQAFTAPAGSHYYLITAQGDNMEGSLGTASNGTERPGGADYCDYLGYGNAPWYCAKDWFNPVNGEPQPLIDYNPHSETYLQAINLSDFRGKVIRIDVSALDCTYCQLQAPFAASVEHDYAARDMVGITIMTQSFTTLAPIPTALCGSRIAIWANNYGVTNPIVCDVDSNGNGNGDATDQWWRGGCGGTPQNHYIDQGFRPYSFVCGGELTYATIENQIINEVNPESCE